MNLNTLYVICMAISTIFIGIAVVVVIINNLKSSNLSKEQIKSIIYDTLLKKIDAIVNDMNQVDVIDRKIRSNNRKLNDSDAKIIHNEVCKRVENQLTGDEYNILERMFPNSSISNAISYLVEASVYKNHSLGCFLTASESLCSDVLEPVLESTTDIREDDDCSNDNQESSDGQRYDTVSQETHRN